MKGIWPSPEYLAFRRQQRAREAADRAQQPYPAPVVGPDVPPGEMRVHCGTCDVDWLGTEGSACWINPHHRGQRGSVPFVNHGSK